MAGRNTRPVSAPVAQGIEHGSPKAGVGGSNPLWGTFGGFEKSGVIVQTTPSKHEKRLYLHK